MKCACGNEHHKPRVKPYPVSFKDTESRKAVALLYNGGFWEYEPGKFRCWFCTFPST